MPGSRYVMKCYKKHNLQPHWHCYVTDPDFVKEQTYQSGRDNELLGSCYPTCPSIELCEESWGELHSGLGWHFGPKIGCVVFREQWNLGSATENFNISYYQNVFGFLLCQKSISLCV